MPAAYRGGPQVSSAELCRPSPLSLCIPRSIVRRERVEWSGAYWVDACAEEQLWADASTGSSRDGGIEIVDETPHEWPPEGWREVPDGDDRFRPARRHTTLPVPQAQARSKHQRPALRPALGDSPDRDCGSRIRARRLRSRTPHYNPLDRGSIHRQWRHNSAHCRSPVSLDNSDRGSSRA